MTAERIPLKRKPADVFTLEELVKLFDLRDFKNVEDAWWETEETSALWSACYDLDYEFDCDGWRITKECERCEGTGYVKTVLNQEDVECNVCSGSGQIEIEREDLYDTPEYEKAHAEFGDSLYSAWKSAVESTLEFYFDRHELRLPEVELTYRFRGKEYSQPGYRIVPNNTWQVAAQCIADTESGYGYFYYPTAKALKDSYPYANYRQTVLNFLYNMSYHGAVYGYSSMSNMQEGHFEDYTRNL